jgi:NADPH:quinone reductase-like Zn-dependent oxidoreductase
MMDGDLPQTMGYEAVGIVDELGEGVTDVAVGDRVFGLGGGGAAQAELAVVAVWAPIPRLLDLAGAAALPSVVDHDRLGQRSVAKLGPVPRLGFD